MLGKDLDIQIFALLSAKLGLYMEVVLVSLMTEAFHADVIFSTVSMVEQDKMDLST